MQRFQDRVALVTGGATGIGAVTAELFARQGASVGIVDVNADQGKATEAALRADGLDVWFLQGSVADEDSVLGVYAAVRDRHGKLDILFNNAGIVTESFVASTSLSEWRKVLAVNVDGAFLMSHHAIPLMVAAGAGAIINSSSICGHIALPGGASYNTSKHAIEGLTKSLAVEHAADGIRVNAVCPGYVNTAMGRADVEGDPAAVGRHPLGRIAEPHEIASAVAFLASDEASFITGASLMVDGGYTAQ